MIVKDWALEAATEIASYFSFGVGRDSYVTPEQRTNVAKNYRKIILEHSPMKPDVAYMPVPRCKTCAHWASHTGACTAISIDAPKLPRGSLLLLTTADFGCVRWKEK